MFLSGFKSRLRNVIHGKMAAYEGRVFLACRFARLGLAERRMGLQVRHRSEAVTLQCSGPLQ